MAAKAIISGSHTNFVYVEHNDEVILDKKAQSTSTAADDDIMLNMQMVHDFATTAPLDEIAFMKETMTYNMGAATAATRAMVAPTE